MLRMSQQEAPMHGSVTLILGCMFSGKSSALQASLRTHMKGYKLNTCHIKHALDTRYDSDAAVSSTHDGITMPTLCASHLQEIDATVQRDDYRVIGVDEGQFFDDLVHWTNVWADQGRIVIVAALAGDKDARTWPSIAPLIGSADDIQWHHAVCVQCHRPASRSLARHNDANTVHIGTDYDPMCRTCYRIALHAPAT